MVHHGSLLFDTDLEEMVRATTVDRYKIESKSIKSVRERVTNIARHLREPMSAEAFKEKVVRHILGPEGTVCELTAADRARAAEIGQERFAGWESAYAQGPGFNIQRTGRFPGGTMRFDLEVKKGVIRAAAVSGDFFAAGDGGAIARALTGCRYEREAVCEALERAGVEVYRVAAGEMAQAIAD